jgi:murein DD-endopeptidase MepM/ murein hydrolase activator NlpD
MPPEYSMDIEKTVIAERDYLDSSLAKTRLSPADRAAIKKELVNLKFNPDKIRNNDFFEVVYSTTTGQWVNFWYYPYKSASFYSLKRHEPDSEIESSVKNLSIITSEHSKSGIIEKGSQLWSSMTGNGIPNEVFSEFETIFECRVDFVTSTYPEDVFKVIYETNNISKTGTLTSSRGTVKAGFYGSGKNKFYAFYYEPKQKTKGAVINYFDENGKSIDSLFLKVPFQGVKIRKTSGFNLNRMHPILKIRRPHWGIDYAAPQGTPVSCIGKGRVIFSGWKGGYGNFIIVDHRNGYISRYGHLRKRNVSKGSFVQRGQVIGEVGSTGLSTGPHLDFSVQKNGKFVDFEAISKKIPSTIQLAGKEKEEFLKYAEKMKEIIDKI